ncbi:hypothetical protein GE09DRAFT_1080388 [Coniochaeta sp. 2T2.1]|nr:hypothetical protein GE09DRAFT_1080388 [Coniochaeta sp. 2T2.1]
MIAHVLIAEDAHSKLIRAGFIRQSHSGVFQMLPLGLRVQDKIEKLIDEHMQSLGASKLALSSFSAQSLWEKSGRLTNGVSEFFRLTDRKEKAFLLCPTHEEEITSIVAHNVKSHKEMPLKLYQITRKYRDELRPRHGLLRGREFIMKDLYTFDISVKAALESYEQVQVAYRNLFAELKLPILVAKASSGDMGGDLSHEYHIPTALGEDNVISCTSCDYVANEELAEGGVPEPSPSAAEPLKHICWTCITADRKTLVHVWYPQSGEGSLNMQAIMALVPDLDITVQSTSEITEAAKPRSLKVINLFDGRLRHLTEPLEEDGLAESAADFEMKANPTYESIEYVSKDREGKPLNLLRTRSGDKCPKCADGTLKVQEAIELGHTFHLGTRYSEPLEAKVEVPKAMLEGPLAETEKQSEMVPLQMGCHGIGVTRLIGAVADYLHDEKGLNWPRPIAPYEVVVLRNGLKPRPELLEGSEAVFDKLVGYSQEKGHAVDAVLDDRRISLPLKLYDADLVGYPVIVVVGKYWAEGEVEVQCRRLGVNERVGLDQMPEFVHGLLDQL